MKKSAFIFFALLTYATPSVAGQICGPLGDSSGLSDWTTTADGIPIAYFAVGQDCPANLETTAPEQMCTTTNIVGQAFCTTQYWTEHDLDITSAPTSGDVCWCRRTHVRTGGNLTQDIGPWYLNNIFTDADRCNYQCARSCKNLMGYNCNEGLDIIMFHPVY